jgi:adenylate kinase
MILFFGPPGSGKSVQGQLLVERNGWQWISTGDLFRNSKDPEVLKRMTTGELIDDELTNKVLADALRQIDSNIEVVLDGYPRNIDQVKWLEKKLPEFDRAIHCVVLFEVPRDELIERLAGRGRAEDTLDVISHRLDIYQEKTRPVVDYFHETGLAPVLVIDGTGAIPDIHERIQTAVVSCLQTK